MMRIKVLIVDDDRVVLHGLSNMLNWSKLGFEVVATAFNGSQGLDLFSRFLPHLVITDIKMPVMDGLDMLKAIKKNRLSTRFIILSAFGEFAFAQQAITLGASSYILKKDLNPDTMSAFLGKIKTDLEAQAKTAFVSIVDTVRSFVQDAQISLTEAVSRTEQQLVLHLDLQKDYGLDSLAKSLEKIFQHEFEHLGISCDCIPSALSEPDAMKQWIVRQMSRIDQYKKDAEYCRSRVIANSLSYIRENYNKKDLSVQDVSAHVAMSESWLCNRFKREVGKTMKGYITDLRIQQAKALLMQGRFRIYEIAEMVGFGSAEYFTRVFTKITGSSPYQYREDDKI